MFQRFAAIICLFAATAASTPGQTWERVPPERRWTMLDGLPQSSVNAFAQTPDGMLWVATNAGISRFDGFRFRNYEIKSLAGEPAERIRALIVDKAGNLWIGANQHGVFVMRQDEISQVAAEFTAERLAFDGNGVLYVTSTQMLRRVEAGSAPVVKRGFAGRTSGLVADSEGRIWVSDGEGVYVVAGDAVERDPRVSGAVSSLAACKNGRIYAALSDGVYSIDVRDRSAPPTKVGAPAGHLAVGPYGEVWANVVSGVHRLVDPAGPPSTFSGVEDYDELTRRTALFVDRDGAAWVGTAARGFAGCRLGGPRGFRAETGVPVYGPIAVINGVPHIGTTSGVLRLDGEMLRPAGPNREGGTLARARTMVRTPDGALWIGRSSELQRFDPESGAIGPPIELPFPVRAICTDGDGLIAAGVGAVARVDVKSGLVRRFDGDAFLKAPAEVEYPPVDESIRRGEDLQCVGRDGRGSLWVGGPGFVARFDGAEWRRFGRDEGFPGGTARTFEFGDPTGAAWFGVYGAGLVRIKNDRVSVVSAAHGLPDEHVTALLPSERDMVLFACNRGLYGLRRSELDAAADGVGRLAYEWFGPVAGMVASEGQGAYFPPAISSVDGHWFSMIEGVAFVRSTPQAKAPGPPVARLDALRCGDVVASGLETLTGALGARNLEISYTAASLGAAGSVYFRYRLEGYDADWVLAGSRREAFYTGVPPGKYRFVVEAARRDFVFGGAAHSAAIVVPPFAHETTTARVGAVLCGLGAVFGIWRVRRKARQHRELEERERALTKDVAERTRSLTEEIEQRKRAENELRRYGEELEERVRIRTNELLQAQRLEGIGRLAGGVAHDLNNLLTVVMGGVQSARDDEDCRSRISAALDDAETAARVAADLAAGLLTFSKRQPTRPKVLDPAAAVAACLPMLRRFVGPLHELTATFEEGAPPIYMDPHQLDQVLLNLVINAKEAMPKGGPVTVSVRKAELAGVPATRVSVADRGEGMDETTMARAFEPYFTTKGPGLGTGLGLSICYGIVSNAGGTISLQSAPNAGCVASVVLPAAKGPPEKIEARSPQETRGDARILLVEDQDAVRRVVRRWLDQLGYRVYEAASVAEARTLIASATEPVDVVLTDVVMPDGGGPAAVAAACARFPASRVVFMSGFAGDALDGEVPPGARHLKKPFRRPDLAKCLAEALAAPPDPPADA